MNKENIIALLVCVAVLIFAIFFLAPRGYPMTKGEISLMASGDISQCYTKWGNYSQYIDWSTAYDRVFADTPRKDELTFNLTAYMPHSLFIPLIYTQDFVPNNIETMAGIGWERILKPDMWNMDIGAAALWNNTSNAVYCDIFIKNITQLKFLGIFKLTNTLKADIPIGEQFRLAITTKLSINAIDITGLTGFKTNLELTNIEELKGGWSSTNRIGLQFQL
jgi:hypothetical protein